MSEDLSNASLSPSGDEISQSSSTNSSKSTVVFPENENPMEESNKLIEELDKRKEDVKKKKEWEEKMNIASNILFVESEESVKLISEKSKGSQTKIINNKRTTPSGKQSFPQVIKKEASLRPDIKDVSSMDFSRKHITSPFELKRFIGYDPEVYAKNMTTAKEFAILVVTGNLLLIYDYNSEVHLTLQGHRNRVVSTSVDAKVNWIASSDTGPDGSIIIWDATKCSPIHIIWEFNKTGCYYVKLSPCGRYLLGVVEKSDKKNIKIISIWEWVLGHKIPDVSVELDTDELGSLKKIDFCSDKCEFIIVTTEKQIIFLTLEEIDQKRNLSYYKPKGLSNKIRTEMGSFNDSVYVKGSHMAITASSTGQIVIWSDVPWNFFENEPVRDLCNKKNAFMQLQLDRYSIELIYSVDDQIITINSKGMIFFYNQRLQVLYVIKELKGCSPVVSLSFHHKKRSIEGSIGNFAPGSPREEKMMEWERVQNPASCWCNPEKHFDTRDFIATTDNGDIVYVNFSHNKVHHILKNQFRGVTSLDAHPQFDLLCIGTDHAMVHLYDFIKNVVVKQERLPVLDSLSKFDDKTIDIMAHITYLKYGPSGNFVACGTKSGDVWILDGISLKNLARISNTTFPIVKIVFSRMTEYFAYYDSFSHMFLMNCKKEPPSFIGKIRPHSKPIADVAFVTKNNNYLYSLGLDRYFVKYIVNECECLGFIKINVYFRMDQIEKGTCLFPDPSARTTMLMFSETGKCRFINLDKMNIYRTVQGPLMRTGLTHVEALSIPNETEYLLFVCNNEMGLLKCPVDGNPFKWLSHATASEQIEYVSVAKHGKYVFCKGKNEHITMWEVNTLPLNALEVLGGVGADPFATLLSIDPRSPSLQDIQDLFFYCQVAHKGLYNDKAFSPSDKIGACDVSSAFRALGYFMTDYEECLLMKELVGDSNLKLSEVEVSFDQFIQLFVNHKVCRLSEPAMKNAFCNLYKRAFPQGTTIGDEVPGIPLREFLHFLESYGDKFDPCSSYIYLRALIQPFTKQIEEELLYKIEKTKTYPYRDNKYYDFVPEGKCRFINLDKMNIYRTVQGPLMRTGLTHVEALSIPNETEYLLFVCNNEMGLLKCPVDGNPFKWLSHATASEQIEYVSVAKHGKYVFCKGKNEHITMWEVNTLPLNALEVLGGVGADPFATLLSIDPRSPSLQDIQDLFFYCQVAHKGLYNDKAFSPSDKIGACDVSSAFRALGYFMTDYEECLLMKELVGDSNLKLSEVEVSFDQFIQLFVNHKVCRLSEPAMKNAFCNLYKRAFPQGTTIGDEVPGIPLREFLHFLESYGDKFDPCSSYIYLRALIQPFTKQIEEELLYKIEKTKTYPYRDNKYYDFVPEVITYDYFKNVIIGL